MLPGFAAKFKTRETVLVVALLTDFSIRIFFWKVVKKLLKVC